MKKCVLCVMLAIMVLAAMPLVAEEAAFKGSDPSMAISINPFATLLTLLTGGIGFEGSFEMKLSQNLSLYIPAMYYGWSYNYSGYAYSWSYLSIGGEVHYFLADAAFNFGASNALRGLWAGGGVNLQFWTGTGYYTWSETVIDIMAKAGYKWMWGNTSPGFYLEPYLGFHYGISVANGGTLPTTAPSYSGLGYGLNIGYAF